MTRGLALFVAAALSAATAKDALGQLSVPSRGTQKARPAAFNPFGTFSLSRFSFNPFGFVRAAPAAPPRAPEAAPAPVATSQPSVEEEEPPLAAAIRPPYRPPVRSPYRPPPRPPF
jgi:hypothetical protein